MAFSPSNTGMLAVGSYSQTTAIYREDNMELLYVLHGQEGGITHVSQDTLLIPGSHCKIKNKHIFFLTYRSNFLEMEITYTLEAGR